MEGRVADQMVAEFGSNGVKGRRSNGCGVRIQWSEGSQIKWLQSLDPME